MPAIHNNAEYRITLRIFQIIAGLGLILSVGLLISGETAAQADWRHFLYTTWFAIAIVSIETILNWYKAGVYILAGATLVVTLVDLLGGMATLGGASLGVLVFAIIFIHIRPVWNLFE